MRSNRHFRPRNQPLKSPSPDTSRKSIIKSTVAPINSYKEYVSRSQSKNSRQSQSFTHSQPLPIRHDKDAHIHNLQAKILQLQNFRLKHDQLFLSNEKLRQQVKQLQQKINKQNMWSQPQPQDSILRQFKERISYFQAENSKLNKKLEETALGYNQLRRQNQFMKSQSFGNIQNIRPSSFPINEIQQLKKNFYERSQSMLNHYTRMMDTKLQQALKKQQVAMQRVQAQHNFIIRHLQSQQPRFGTPISFEHDSYTSQKSDILRIKQGSKRMGSQTPIERLNEPNRKDQQNSQQLEYELGLYKLKCEQYERQQKENEKIQRSSRDRILSQSSEKNRENEMLTEKVSYLEKEVEQRRQENMRQRESCLQKEREAQEVVARQIRRYEQNLEQERQKTKHYKEQLDLQHSRFQEESIEHQTTLKKNSHENELLKNQCLKAQNDCQYLQSTVNSLKNQRDGLLQRLMQLQSKAQRQLHEKDVYLSRIISEYKSQLTQVKRILGGQKMEGVLKDTELIFQEKHFLEQQVEILRSQNGTTVNELKRKILRQEESIIAFQKEVGLLRAQVGELRKENDRLRMAIDEYTREEKASSMAEPIIRSFQSVSITSRIRECVGQTVRTIDILEQKMNQHKRYNI